MLQWTCRGMICGWLFGKARWQMEHACWIVKFKVLLWQYIARWSRMVFQNSEIRGWNFPSLKKAPPTQNWVEKRCLPFWKRCWTNETCVQQLDRSESETLEEIPWQPKFQMFGHKTWPFWRDFFRVCHGMLWLHVSLGGFWSMTLPNLHKVIWRL